MLTLLEETFEMRKRLLALSLPKLKEKVKAILQQFTCSFD